MRTLCLLLVLLVACCGGCGGIPREDYDRLQAQHVAVTESRAKEHAEYEALVAAWAKQTAELRAARVELDELRQMILDWIAGRRR